ncbi:gp4.3 [Escherichia phage 285P]|uniref:Gp4.3 n=1 Tax=Escherichia phage 285P TaxID=669008 RepID=D3W698_9CAUD|nr:gp4.3 [Escherichia phage 285P]ACV32466.1 gp4.3 [Escherichia phage 285P]
MFKFINTLGKLVVKMYFREAKRLNDKARKDAEQAQRLAKRARLLSEDASAGVTSAAKIAAKATDLNKFFL